MRILFADGAAEWLIEEAAWRTDWGKLPECMKRAVPNLEEWESFWLRSVEHEADLDARDLCFDGDPVRSVDWTFRGRRWVTLRGRGPPTSGLPDSYSVQRFEEGWILFDEILERHMFLVAMRATH